MKDRRHFHFSNEDDGKTMKVPSSSDPFQSIPSGLYRFPLAQISTGGPVELVS